MTRRGISLVEIMIALALLSVVMLAVAALHSSSSRLSKSVQDEIKLRHELDYVLRDMERNLIAARNPIIDPAQIEGCTTNCLSVQREDDTETITIDYLYDAGQKRITRRITNGAGAVTTDVLTTGVIVRVNGAGGAVQPMFEIVEGEANDRVQVNISAESDGKTLPGITKSILLRGVKT